MSAQEEVFILSSGEDASFEDARAFLEQEFITPLEQLDFSKSETSSTQDAYEKINELDGNVSIQDYLKKLYRGAASSVERKAKSLLNENLRKIYSLQTNLESQKTTMLDHQKKLLGTVNFLQQDLQQMSKELNTFAKDVHTYKQRYTIALQNFQTYDQKIEQEDVVDPQEQIQHKIIANGLKHLHQAYQSRELRLQAKETYYGDIASQLKLQKEGLLSVNYNIQLLDNELNRVAHQRRIQEEGSPLANILRARTLSNDVVKLEQVITDNLKQQRDIYNSAIKSSDTKQRRSTLSETRDNLTDLVLD